MTPGIVMSGDIYETKGTRLRMVRIVSSKSHKAREGFRIRKGMGVWGQNRKTLYYMDIINMGVVTSNLGLCA